MTHWQAYDVSEGERPEPPPPAPAAIATCESFDRQNEKRERERERRPRGRPKWSGSGSLRPDSEAASAVIDRDHGGVVFARERGDDTRLRVAVLMHEGRRIVDVREERWTEFRKLGPSPEFDVVEMRWTWTHRGIQLDPIEARALVDALEDACTT